MAHVPRTVLEFDAAIAGGLSPVQIVTESLQRIDSRNDALRAMIFVDREGALAAAHVAEREIARGHKRGPLHGLPVAVKDVVDVAGWPTTAGSGLFAGHVAQANAACVTALKAAGAIVVGKTNMHELTVGGHDNPWFGKVVNPLDRSRGTGGTSSGSAAAVAAGFCVAALGTDSGGSNRSPAAATGLVGFKPSNGMVDGAGIRPTAPSLDTVGPITRSVEDARIVFDALRGGPPACRSADAGLPPGVVLAVCPDLHGAAIDPPIGRSHAAWFRDLEQAGVTIRTIAYAPAADLVEAGLAILRFEFARAYGPMVEQQPDRVSERVREFLAAACRVDEAAYAGACASRDRMRRGFAQAMQGVDLLAVPTAPGLAPRLSDECTHVGDAIMPFGAAGARFRLWANTLGMPALALPLPCDAGLPASIQLAAAPGQDDRLLDLAAALGRIVP